MEEKIQEIHSTIKELFPDAVSVSIFVNHSDGISITPNYKTDLVNFSMKKLNGEWVQKSKTY